ncbi:YhcG family protein [Undibacterium sp.]|uniref:PDDEXK nuclease domain-containing protein n=1 Tax=Undibacterium sp. TaxID=1914977 RepID=UPI0027317932|nr:PDDEXK nuclease domain-containing protein [Undibacterium sp.]MDP1977515.1 PDDEXK nuclease domain-containing protein [Undibacterium sp.]
MTVPVNIQPLYEQVRLVLDGGRQQVRHTINDVMVQSYWHVGRLIVEDEQGGAARAQYGKQTLQHLSQKLSAEYGKGFSPQSLWNFRQFYLEFPILSTAWRELRWSHFKVLMRIKDRAARDWYTNEAISQGWSVAALDRQVSTLFYERLLSSQDKLAVQSEAVALIAEQTPNDPRDFIRDPYILEFIGAHPSATLYEKELETNLIGQLQNFLLELGKGFAFVARQKQLRVEGDDFFVDLVFYNYLLKCFLLVDLKVGKLAHQDVGQMDMYVRVFEEQYRGEGDNPTLGLILFSERNEAVAKYSLLADSQHLFASRYRAFLPTEEQLQAELQRDRAVLENAQTGDDA